MKRYDIHRMLEGLLYDVSLILRDGDNKRAYKLLKHKIKEIETLDKSQWAKLEWGDNQDDTNKIID